MKSTSWMLLLASVLASACQTSSKVADLAQNEEIYRSPEFTSKAPGDRTVFVGPVVDARRTDILPAAIGGYPIAYDGDDRWQRPVATMVDDVLRSEVGFSQMFAAMDDQAKNADIVVLPSLVTFMTGAMEMDAGARALCELGLRLQVYGPLGANNERPLLLDQVYGDRHVSEPTFKPVSRIMLAGRMLHVTMQKMLLALDGSNISREGLPLNVATVAPPAAPPVSVVPGG